MRESDGVQAVNAPHMGLTAAAEERKPRVARLKAVKESFMMFRGWIVSRVAKILMTIGVQPVRSLTR